MRVIISFWVLILIIGCKTQYGYDSIGLFVPENRLPNQQYFMTLESQSDTEVPKLSDGELSYFVWKTVKYNYEVDEEESFSAYRTLLNKEIEELSPEDQSYVQNSANLLNNYLFFIDDYRCVYLSEDDDRSDESFGRIPMYFDDKNYKIRKDLFGSRLEQIIRGYYRINGDEIFFDFGGVTHFYVRGKIQGEQITFESIHIPEQRLVKASGINNTYVDFDAFLNEKALPIFEMPVDDLVREPRFTLVTGLRSKTNKIKRKLEIEKDIMGLYNAWPSQDVDRIIDVDYHLDANPPIRTYTIEIFNPPFSYDTITVDEELLHVETW